MISFKCDICGTETGWRRGNDRFRYSEMVSISLTCHGLIKGSPTQTLRFSGEWEICHDCAKKFNMCTDKKTGNKKDLLKIIEVMFTNKRGHIDHETQKTANP